MGPRHRDDRHAPHEGTPLERANDRSEMVWLAWLDVHPDILVDAP